jgi:hypothetical protein
VQFFANPSGENEDKVSFTFSPAQEAGAGKMVTATATGSEGTSEFSAPRTVVAR